MSANAVNLKFRVRIGDVEAEFCGDSDFVRSAYEEFKKTFHMALAAECERIPAPGQDIVVQRPDPHEARSRFSGKSLPINKHANGGR